VLSWCASRWYSGPGGCWNTNGAGRSWEEAGEGRLLT
jgi:hypothetical protein